MSYVLRHTLALSALTIGFICASPAIAGNIAINQIGEFDGPTLTNPTYPQPSLTIGTFNYTIPVGTQIIAASVSGFFGTVFAPGTALENLFVGGIDVANCVNQSDPCWNVPFGVQTPWSYTFTPGQFSALTGGAVNYSVVQTGDFQVESGITTLSITVSPEPSSVAMFCGGLSLVILACRRKRA
jgi:hypothetical protein